MLNGKGDKGPKKSRKEEIVKPGAPPKNMADRVFVVQFRDSTEPGLAHFAGRAEHVMSGENTVFETPEALVAFFGRVMQQLMARSQKGKKP